MKEKLKGLLEKLLDNKKALIELVLVAVAGGGLGALFGLSILTGALCFTGGYYGSKLVRLLARKYREKKLDKGF